MPVGIDNDFPIPVGPEDSSSGLLVTVNNRRCRVAEWIVSAGAEDHNRRPRAREELGELLPALP